MASAAPQSSVLRYTSYLRRLASVSVAEFSTLWYDHAALAAPWFIYHNTVGYTQTHLSPQAPVPIQGLNYDGMVDLYFDPETCSLFNPSKDSHSDVQKDGARRYFEDVILVDEKRFWDRTGKGNVTGSVGWEEGRTGVVGIERKVIVEGKIVIDLPTNVIEKWKGYNTGIEL